MTDPVIVADVCSLALPISKQPAYDRPLELRELYKDPRTGAEHYVVRYRAGTKARWHRHDAAHTFIVVAGQLVANESRHHRRQPRRSPSPKRSHQITTDVYRATSTVGGIS